MFRFDVYTLSYGCPVIERGPMAGPRKGLGTEMKQHNIKLISSEYHRNGVGGEGFRVALIQDEDGTKKVCVDFGRNRFAVLEVDDLVENKIGYGHNWRGDWYMDKVRALPGYDPYKEELKAPLTACEKMFLRLDHGFDRIIEKSNGEIHAIKNGQEVFVGWDADDVRRLNPAMSRHWK